MEADQLWVITAYFNPAGYKRRAANFRRFRESLDAPLIVAEMSTTGEFEVTRDSRTVVIRLGSSDLMWQKESLLNVALDHVPLTAKFVAWLDCDVLFEQKDWQHLAKAKLEQTPLVQLFTDLYDLPVSGALTPLPPRTGVSIASLHVRGRRPMTAFNPTKAKHVRMSSFGLAWAARIEVMRTHRFYDAMIIGSGDRALACAALGHYGDAVASLRLSQARHSHYEAWARPFYETVRGHVGSLPGRVFHLWHGDIIDRSYMERHARLADFSFDPAEDLVRTEDGLWRWRKPRPDIAAMMEAYFASRHEDGRARDEPDEFAISNSAATCI